MKCSSSLTSWWGQAALRQYDMASPSGRTIGSPQLGHSTGISKADSPAVAPVGQRLDDLGDHLAGPLDDHDVADHQVLGADVVLVVQCGELHRRARDVDGLEDGVRVDASGPSHVYAYVQEPGHHPGRRELVGDGPAGLASDDAQVRLVVEPVHLDDHAVAVVVEAFGGLQPVAVVVDHLSRRPGERVVGVHLEAETLQIGQGLPLGHRRCALSVPQAVHEHVERPLGRSRRVQLAKRARGGVPGRGVLGEALRGAGFVELAELRPGEVYLSAHLEEAGGVAAEDAQGDGVDRAQVLGHVLADGAVAPGRAPNQDAVLVGKGHGEAVVLELAYEVEAVPLQQSGHPGVPGQELFAVEGVREAEHGPGVPDLRESGGWLGSDALSGRVGRDQVRALLLDPAQLAHQRVILGVADLGTVEDEVEVVVPVDVRSEESYPLPELTVLHRVESLWAQPKSVTFCHTLSLSALGPRYTGWQEVTRKCPDVTRMLHDVTGELRGASKSGHQQARLLTAAPGGLPRARVVPYAGSIPSHSVAFSFGRRFGIGLGRDGSSTDCALRRTLCYAPLAHPAGYCGRCAPCEDISTCVRTRQVYA